MSAVDDVAAEVKDWLGENWDPDLTVGEWWERLGTSGWAAPALPADAFGKGLSREESVRVQRTIAEFGALGAPGGLGLLLAAPTIATHGDEAQKQLYISEIVTGRKAWCQLFSEPNAGSDLAGLQTRAERDGDEFVINGQKVWTSGGQVADMGMLLARTDVDVPKHQGISYFAIDMHQPGIEVRPLREMTGRALFNEVFLTDARVPADAVIGGLNNGWAVANTTLAFERAGLGAGGGSEAGGAATPGTVAGNLGKRAGDFVQGMSQRGAAMPGVMSGASNRLLVELAKQHGKIDDPTVRQDLMRLHTLNEIARFMSLRQKALRTSGGDIPGLGNIAKLSMSQILRLSRDLGLRILGPHGTLHAYTAEDRTRLDEATGQPANAMVTEMALFTQAPSIYGGTDEVQHNILGERVLGLPKEPSNDRTTAFRDLPKNG
ncbi:MAG TPA: acyl-CoA dehydrogenase family protein [Acidimicrobiales bacterium]|nr:acyl-CoA dehydrogenase family protein [Acidimicrobiales bacterium]